MDVSWWLGFLEAAPCPYICPRGRARSSRVKSHETSLEATACALARTLAGGRIRFLLASVLQAAIELSNRGRLTRGSLFSLHWL